MAEALAHAHAHLHAAVEPSVVGERVTFIGGLHRSGTTPLARWLAEHPAISAFSETGVWEDEGQHLQDVYPTAAEHGGPGEFARDPDAHLTEYSPLANTSSRDRLASAWAPHWDLSSPVLLEKSPPNLIRTRFLQRLYPGARFIVVVRHPVAVAYATKKWTRSSIASLIEHWVIAHELMLADAAAVKRITLVRYEDLIADPAAELSRLFEFCGVQPIERDWDADPRGNDDYFARWEIGPDRMRRTRHRRLIDRFSGRVAPFGYDLAEPRNLQSIGLARFAPPPTLGS
jgi:hypothetical protein